MKRIIVHFAGRVQGVGFRFTTHEIATSYPVTGYVQNLNDGRVLLVAEGTSKDLKELVEEILVRREEFVTSHSLESVEANGEFSEFQIRT